MIIKFKVSAPSKLSLFGEHTVKYGKKSLTAAINLRTTLTFYELADPCPGGVIQMDFLQIDLNLGITLRKFIDFYRNCTFNENNDELYRQALQFVVSNFCPYRTSKHQRSIALSFVYLLAYVSHKEKIDIKSFFVHFSTQFVVDKDSVCLASSTVCLAACFLRWSSLQKGNIDDFDDSDLYKIYSYASRCKKICRESGIAEVAACTYGSIIQYQIGEDLRYIPFFEMLNVRIFLIDSKQTQNLEAQAQRVAEVMNKCPEAANSIFDTINNATKVAASIFEELGPLYLNEHGLETKRLTIMTNHNILLALINLNQRLLHLLDVSHFLLDKICSIAISHEFYGKYTDIGDGRYAYIWCRPNVTVRHISRLCMELKANNFDITETTVAYNGVKIEY